MPYNIDMPENTKVLFIEDDDFLRSLVVTKLEKEGLQVATASDGKDAMERINAEKPDLLLLDIMLPNNKDPKAGFQVLEEVRNSIDWKTLKVIIFSNLGDEEDLRRGEELGADEYLIKANFTLDELVEKIKGMLA
jgi:DNA-binding response OmpR family regulator